MIKINDTFEIEKDPYCWNLHEWRDGINRTTGKTTRTKKLHIITVLFTSAESLLISPPESPAIRPGILSEQ